MDQDGFVLEVPVQNRRNNLSAFDCHTGHFQRLEPYHRFDQLLQLAAIGLNNVVQKPDQ